MYGLFENAKSFNQPLNHWDTSYVKSMTALFDGARLFNQPLNDWDTSNVELMSVMFRNASAFNQSLEKWDVTKVKNNPASYMYMFYISALSKTNWDKMVKENKGWSEMDKKALGITY